MILIDSRDGSKELAEMACMEDRCTLTRLDFEIDGKVVACGDAMLAGQGPEGRTLTVGVEVKSIRDALESINSGRLGGTQVPRMMKVYDVIFILVHGLSRPGYDNHLQLRRGKAWKTFTMGSRKIPWSFIEGFYLTAQLKASLAGKPLFVRTFYDLREVAVFLTVLDHWLEKPWNKHRGLDVFDKSHELSAPPDSDPVEEQMARIAAQLPVVDWVRGWAAARHFESVEEMVQATPRGWMQVKGIGKVIAHAVYDAIHRKKGGA